MRKMAVARATARDGLLPNPNHNPNPNPNPSPNPSPNPNPSPSPNPSQARDDRKLERVHLAAVASQAVLREIRRTKPKEPRAKHVAKAKRINEEGRLPSIAQLSFNGALEHAGVRANPNPNPNPNPSPSPNPNPNPSPNRSANPTQASSSTRACSSGVR